MLQMAGQCKKKKRPKVDSVKLSQQRKKGGRKGKEGKEEIGREREKRKGKGGKEGKEKRKVGERTKRKTNLIMRIWK